MIIPGLVVDHFRCFEHLEVAPLGRVNLVVGKNGVGKSFLLEALELLASMGSAYVFWSQLVERGDTSHRATVVGGTEHSLPLPEAAFTDRDASRSMVLKTPDGNQRVSLRYVALPEADRPPGLDVEHAFAVPGFKTSGSRYHRLETSLESVDDSPRIAQRVRAALERSSSSLASMWDRIVLEGAEDRVLGHLNLIAPIERLTFTQPTAESPSRAVVRLRGSPHPTSLTSLGDGVARLLRLAAMLEGSDPVQPSNGRTPRSPFGRVLLIDEIESGLHYSIHDDLWQFVFSAAERLDVQVVATTHSWDCIEAFTRVAPSHAKAEASLVRLVRRKDRIDAITMTGEELSVIERDRLEVR